MKVLLYLLLISSICVSAQPDWIEVRSISEWEKTLELSQTHRRILFVYLDQDECPPCEEMVNTTLSQKEIENHINSNFLPVHINVSSSLGRRFSDQFKIDQSPSILWATGEEFVWKLSEGLLEPNELTAEMDELRSLVRTYPQLLSYAILRGDSLKVDTWMELMFISSINTTDYQQDIFNSFERNLDWDSLSSPRYWNYINNYVSDLRSPIYQYIAQNPQEVLGSDFDWDYFYDLIYETNMTFAVANQDSSIVKDIERYLLPVAPFDSSSTRNDTALIKLQLWQEYYLGTNQFKKYLSFSDSTLENIELSTPQLIHQVNTVLKLSLSDKSLNTVLRWVNQTLEHEDDVELYIMKADLLIATREFIKAKETLLQTEDREMTATQEDSIEYLLYIIESRY